MAPNPSHLSCLSINCRSKVKSQPARHCIEYQQVELLQQFPPICYDTGLRCVISYQSRSCSYSMRLIPHISIPDLTHMVGMVSDKNSKTHYLQENNAQKQYS